MDITYDTILFEVVEPFAYITLNRPDARNAMSQQMVAELRDAFATLAPMRSVRGIVLAGANGIFCAGGDLKEMQLAYANPDYESSQSTANFDALLQAVNTAPQVVVAKIEGAAMGGGLGLISVCDIAIARTDAFFAFPEVRLGIVPALISPYVISRMGMANARRLMLTGARFDAQEALKFGLVNEVATPDEIDEQLALILADLRECAPSALAACKNLILQMSQQDFSGSTGFRAQLLDDMRQSQEGQEGMLSFIRKSKPAWARVDESTDNATAVDDTHH